MFGQISRQYRRSNRYAKINELPAYLQFIDNIWFNIGSQSEQIFKFDDLKYAIVWMLLMTHSKLNSPLKQESFHQQLSLTD